MSKRVFISYSHHQGQWVCERLVPILRAAGCADVLLDRERFRAGRGLKGQMDATQDQADVSLLVLTPRLPRQRLLPPRDAARPRVRPRVPARPRPARATRRLRPLRLPARLRAETTLTVEWIAKRLGMGSRSYLNHLPYRRRKPCTK